MRSRIWMISGLVAVALLAAACGSSGSSGSGGAAGTPTPTTATSSSNSGGKTAVLKTSNTSLGQVVTDSSGYTLYWYAADTSTASKCTGGCASTWPPVIGTPQAASGVSLPGTLATITRSDGTIQATYAGHPLYRYTLDSAPGQTTGDGVGGVWHAVRVSGGAAPSPSQSSSGSGGGGGYGY